MSDGSGTGDGRTPIELVNGWGWRAAVLPFGARLHSLRPVTSHGPVEVVVGPADTTVYGTTPFHLGATVGRVANRIRDGRFTVEGVEVHTTTNEGGHTLHGGGPGAFGAVVWEVLDRAADRVLLGHVSPAGSEGFPGRVEAQVEYELGDDTLEITMTATTDATTPLSMTNHTYWNLRGDGGTVLDHELTVVANQLVVTDESLVPTGELLDLTGTPYDLRAPRRIGESIALLDRAGLDGFDDPFLLDDGSEAVREVARLREPTTGRTLVLSSDQPCLQLYSCNEPGIPWRDGSTLDAHAAVALEPQAVPDAVNLTRFASPLLEPGEQYTHRLLARLDVS